MNTVRQGTFGVDPVSGLGNVDIDKVQLDDNMVDREVTSDIMASALSRYKTRLEAFTKRLQYRPAVLDSKPRKQRNLRRYYEVRTHHRREWGPMR